MTIKHELIRWLAVGALLIASSSAVAAQSTPVPALVVTRFFSFCPHALTRNFPTVGPVQTSWTICWREVAGNNSLADPNGLVIGPVYFKKSPNSPAMRVLWDMRVSDYFVPYHPGSPRYYDLSGYNFTLTGVTAADCPLSVGGSPLSPHVCKEVHDRGLMWKDYTGVRRGEELVLWGAIDAANYRYIQRYVFRDDGVIEAWVGATGQNLPGMEMVPHTHNAIWRVDLDVDGVTNSASHVWHSENIGDPAGTAADWDTPIALAQGLNWSARSQDAIEVVNPGLHNKAGDVSGYILMPQVTGGGLTQHHETFTQHDFWVTPYNASQFAASKLPTYVAGAPSVANRDLVVWYKGSLHHHPRDEDGAYGAGGIWKGTAHVMWTGMMLMPHDLFDCSPFYGACP